MEKSRKVSNVDSKVKSYFKFPVFSEKMIDIIESSLRSNLYKFGRFYLYE